MRRPTCLAMLMLIGTIAVPLNAGFITIPQPTAPYTSSTTLLPISAGDGSNVNFLNDAILTATFSAPMQVSTVPTTWATWNTPPAVENANPVVLVSPGTGATLLRITFSSPLSIFGLEAEPDAFDTAPTTTETFFNGATTLGSIQLNPNGNGGALLFAASSSTPITSVTVTASNTDFAIAQLRYSLAPVGTPEPSTWITLASGLAVLGYIRRRKLV